MKKKKTITWVCKCKFKGFKCVCELKTEDITGKPYGCPYNYDDGVNWEEKKQK